MVSLGRAHQVLSFLRIMSLSLLRFKSLLDRFLAHQVLVESINVSRSAVNVSHHGPVLYC